MKVEAIGYAISLIGVLPLFVGGVTNLLKHPTAVKNMQEVNFPMSFLPAFGVSVITIDTGELFIANDGISPTTLTEMACRRNRIRPFNFKHYDAPE